MNKTSEVVIEDITFVGNERFCTGAEAERLRGAKTLYEMGVIGEIILKRMPRPVSMVCGPMTSGKRTLKENYERFGRAITILREEGTRNVFSQLPFYHGIFRFMQSPNYAGLAHIINGLYLPLFEKRLIENPLFLSDWEDSIGAKLEHRYGQLLDLNIGYLPPEF